MRQARTMLSNEAWERIEPLVSALIGSHCHRQTDNRKFFEAVLWVLRTGAPWRDLPAEFGLWNSVFQRFRRWANKNVWAQLEEALRKESSGQNKHSAVFLDSTVVRAHQHAAGAKGGRHAKRWAGLAADFQQKYILRRQSRSYCTSL